MRLIDADELLNEIDETAIEVENARSGETIKKAFLQCLAVIRENIVRKPIAYDLDRVVEQIEELKKECADPAQDYCPDYFIDRAVEIVKAGGTNG